MSPLPDPPPDMPEVEFDGITLHEVIDGLYILDYNEPKNKPKERNKVSIPGRDYDWDFGSPRKIDFDVTVNIVVVAGDDDLESKLDLLGSIVETPDSRELLINGSRYFGQTFEPMSVDRATGGGYALVEVVWECREPTEQDE